MRVSALAILVVGLISLVTTAVRAGGSTAPPSHPNSAIYIHDIDAISPGPGHLKHFVCKGYGVPLKHDDPHVNVQYFKVRTNGQKVDLYVDMKEDPPGSMHIDFLDANLKFIERFITMEHEEARITGVPAGTYYFQIGTATDVSRRPDGRNVGFVTLRGLPAGFPSNSPAPSPIDLGDVKINKAAGYTGRLYRYNQRSLRFSPVGNDNICPVVSSGLLSRYYDDFVVRSEKGQLKISGGVVRNQNGELHPFQIKYLVNNDWITLPVGPQIIDHAGGELRLRAGNDTGTSFSFGDMLIDYTISVERMGL